jgi:hypothetical protein
MAISSAAVRVRIATVAIDAAARAELSAGAGLVASKFGSARAVDTLAPGIWIASARVTITSSAVVFTVTAVTAGTAAVAESGAGAGYGRVAGAILANSSTGFAGA